MFHQVMDTILAGLKWQTCLVYLSDVVVFSGSFQEHLRRFATVLKDIRKAGLLLNAENCRFGCQELKFLGYVVSTALLRPE